MAGGQPGPVAALAFSQNELRARSRDRVRRNAWAAAGVDLELSSGNLLRAGIEFDRLGRRVAYHLYRSHPEDGALAPMSGTGGMDTVRVPAAEVIHLFRPLRPGQIRGEPWLARALAKLNELDQYDDAELVRKKTAAMFAGFITRLDLEDNLLGEGQPDANVIALRVVVFLEIHPFQDGNGRLSRVLTTLLLLHAGYAYVPYSSLESVIEQNKEAYYLALRQTQGTIRTNAPDWQPWLVFFLRSLAEQVRRLEKKVEREKIVLAALPELSLQIVEFAREHGRVTIGGAIKLTGASRNTLKQHFRALVERGTLNQRGSGRGVWYDLR